MNEQTPVLVFGATGNMGGAVARALLRRGRAVRAATRDTNSAKARALAALGAELCAADMDDRAALDAAFDGVSRVFSVQNWTTSGVDGEVRQGRLVADAAHAAKVTHLVYGSAGMNEPTGIPHFDCKHAVEGYMRELGLPFSVIRPGPFMEVLRDKAFYPALGFWGAGPKVMGWDLPVPWTAVRDIGEAAATMFDEGDAWIGREIELFSDVRSLGEARRLFREVTGRTPFRIPLPLGLFEKMAGPEFGRMWRWMAEWVAENGEAAIRSRLEASRTLVPDLLDMKSWLVIHHDDGK